MKSIVFLIVFTVLVIGIYGAILANKAKENDDVFESQSTEKIRIGNIGEYSIFNVIAKEKGYFKKNGLDATVYEYDSGPRSVAALLDGNVDVAVAAEFVGVSNMFTHKNLRVISQVSRHKAFHIIARKDKKLVDHLT